MTQPKYQIPDEERLGQHRKDSQLAQAKRSLRTIARANIAIARDLQRPGGFGQSPPVPAPAADPTVDAIEQSDRQDLAV